MKYFSLLLAVVLGTAFTSSASAQVVFSDDFSEANGTLLDNKAPDVGNGTWFISATTGELQEINGGVVNSFDNPAGPLGPFTAFSSVAPGGSFTPLAANQVLKFSFSTVASGGIFHGGAIAGFHLYNNPGSLTPQVFIGTSGSAPSNSVWRVEDGAGGSTALTTVSWHL